MPQKGAGPRTLLIHDSICDDSVHLLTKDWAESRQYLQIAVGGCRLALGGEVGSLVLADALRQHALHRPHQPFEGVPRQKENLLNTQPDFGPKEP